jgi:hypothetical protein
VAALSSAPDVEVRCVRECVYSGQSEAAVLLRI